MVVRNDCEVLISLYYVNSKDITGNSKVNSKFFIPYICITFTIRSS